MSIYIITLLICLLISMVAYQTVYVQPMNNYNCLDLNQRYKRIFIIIIQSYAFGTMRNLKREMTKIVLFWEFITLLRRYVYV